MLMFHMLEQHQQHPANSIDMTVTRVVSKCMLKMKKSQLRNAMNISAERSKPRSSADLLDKI